MGRQLQSAAGQEPQVVHHHAAARGPRRREEDVEVARQLRRDQRAGRRAVRQAHEHPGPAHAPVLRAHHRLAAGPGRGGHRRARRRARSRRSRRSGCSAGRSPTCTTVPARGRRPRPSSTGSSRPVRCPSEVPERHGRRRRVPDAPGAAPGRHRAGAVQQGGPAQDRPGRGADRGGAGHRPGPRGLRRRGRRRHPPGGQAGAGPASSSPERRDASSGRVSSDGQDHEARSPATRISAPMHEDGALRALARGCPAP